jgi:lipoate synthase
MKDEEREMRKKVLKALSEGNDCVIIALGNYLKPDEELLDIEFAVNADCDEIFNMFVELMKNKAVRDEARKAILFSDYGKTNDSLNLN